MVDARDVLEWRRAEIKKRERIRAEARAVAGGDDPNGGENEC